VFVFVELPLEEDLETKIPRLKLCLSLPLENHAPSAFTQISYLAAEVDSVGFQSFWTIYSLFMLWCCALAFFCLSPPRKEVVAKR
jgi:hypothetical protein